MFTLTATLFLVGITRTTGVFVFTQFPGDIYFMRGTTAVFEWGYRVDNRTAEFKYIIWQVYNTTDRQYKILLFETETGEVQRGFNIPPSYVGRVTKGKNATLRVTNITFDDAGTYQCFLDAKGLIPDLSSTVQLVVTGRASVSPRDPSAELGDTVNLVCTAVGVPSGNFTWTKLGQKEKISDSSKYSISSSGTGSSQLTIKSITMDDKGHYTCDATVNSVQMNLARVYLQVKFLEVDPPNQGNCPERSKSGKIGEQVSICCPVSGIPPPVVTWEKNGLVLQEEDSTLYTFNLTTDKNFGNYTCTATSGKYQTVPITISVSAKIDESDFDLVDGSDAVFATLKWNAVSEAEYYVVKVTGSNTRTDYVIGTTSSLEFHYNNLVTTDAGEKPDQIKIIAKVLAMNDTRVVATSLTKELIVAKPSTMN